MNWLKYTFITSLLMQIAFSFEPITAGAALLAGTLGFKYFEKIKLGSYCKLIECCHPDVIPHDIDSLKEKLENNLFGQHIAGGLIFRAVASHFENSEKSKKPLVMTFHGTQGTGKNYVTTMIAEALYKEGTKSQYFHLFHGSQYEGRVQENQEAIRKEIYDAVYKCPSSLFVFDEVDKMPPKIFDTIKSVLDYHGTVKGKDFSKAIFIFLTNYGGDEITKVLYHLVNKERHFRSEIKLHHFEKIIREDVWNQEGGLKESGLIKSAVIDFYLPFLPLEEKHVKECIKAEYENFGRAVTDEMVKEIMNYIGFNERTKFAHTGCKTVHAKVQAECFSR